MRGRGEGSVYKRSDGLWCAAVELPPLDGVRRKKIVTSKSKAEVLKKFAADWPDMLGVSRVKFIASGEIAVNDLRDEPRCERSWRRDGTVRQRSDGGMLSDRDAEAVGVH